MRRLALQCVVFVTFVATAAAAQTALPRIAANDNTVPAGNLSNGVLSLKLNVVRAVWHPDRDEDPGIDILAFQEEGRAPSVPAPLVRAPVGTEIRTTVRNTLTDSAIVVFGLSGSREVADSVRILPGEARELVMRAAAAGTYLYYACTRVRPGRSGQDRMLSGALIVDEAGPGVPDRVLVLHQLIDSRLKPYPGAVEEVLTINGRSWPHTERLNYPLGQTIRWRVVNASFGVHPMHLHGAYFSVLSLGTVVADTIYTPAQQRQVVTERLDPLSTMMMEWTPERAGNWLFHCHLNFHIMPHPPLGAVKASEPQPDPSHALHGMGGLVLGTTIHGPVAPDDAARRALRLVVRQYDSIPGEYVPRFSYRFDDETTFAVPGPPIVVRKDEPIAITVVNRAQDPTSVHWHGLEIESYYDGVPHFGGDARRTTPLVAPGDSFVVKLRPPRAGTFIYHSHADEARQQMGGLYGPFIVVASEHQWDREHDRPMVFSDARDTTNAVFINGTTDGVISFKVGQTYRLRLINITLARPNLQVWLMKGDRAVEWNVVAKDGMDLQPHQTGVRPAQQYVSIGETFDVLFTPDEPGELVLSARNGIGTLTSRARFRVE